MATSKTLTPTNVTIQIPDFTDRPDQRVTNNCIDKEADAINALNSNVANISSAEAISFTGSTCSIGMDKGTYFIQHGQPRVSTASFIPAGTTINDSNSTAIQYGFANALNGKIGTIGSCDLLISTQSGSFNNIALPTGKAFSDYRLLYIEPVTANEAPTDNWMIPVAVFKLHNSNAALMIMNFLNDAYSIRFKYSSDTTAACDIRYNGAAQTTYTVKIYGVK